MNQIRLDFPIGTSCFQNRNQQSDGIQAAAPPVNRVQKKAFAQDLVAALVDTRDDMHFMAGLSRRPSHRESV